MSILTKILVVLLALSSIFLCGIIVTHVANTENYKQKFDDRRAELNALKEKVKDLKELLNTDKKDTARLEKKLKGQIASLKLETRKLQNQLTDAEREKADLLQRVNSWASITEDFYKTNDKQRQLFENTFAELNKVKAEQIKERRELSDTTQLLIEKMAIVDMLEAKKKRLVEQKDELQRRLDTLLLPGGGVASAIELVTFVKDTAMPTSAFITEISLHGTVTSVDLKNSMASISIGAADGVQDGMKFHVTRGDEFLCDILIIDVESEQSVGVLEIVQQNPQTGDTVSTNF